MRPRKEQKKRKDGQYTIYEPPHRFTVIYIHNNKAGHTWPSSSILLTVLLTIWLGDHIWTTDCMARFNQSPRTDLTIDKKRKEVSFNIEFADKNS